MTLQCSFGLLSSVTIWISLEFNIGCWSEYCSLPSHPRIGKRIKAGCGQVTFKPVHCCCKRYFRRQKLKGRR
ncbi:Uncharacterized protein TCM_000487 [Theobroma cacao]|uniref:Uncharacterized protein n=1 Tax=Theobroma cacao TaxID=3641 RepID=A0A061DHJ9_THECC|nr:Uncharacterized protein TCM_000487 [Theobroma cacao]